MCLMFKTNNSVYELLDFLSHTNAVIKHLSLSLHYETGY